MRNYLKEILQTKTFRETLITSSGTIVNGLLGLAFYFVLARSLGPVSFGVFSAAIAILTLIGDIANVGSDTGTVRFVGKYINTDRPKALKFLKLSLEVRTVSWLIFLVIGWFFSPFIVKLFFAKPELVLPIRLALVGVGSYLFFSFSTYALQSLQKYWTWNGVNIGTNLVRLLITIVLIYFGFLNQISALTLYIIVPALGFLVGLIFLPKFLSIKNELTVAKEFFHYNIWVAVFTLVAAFGGRIDTLLSTRFLSLYNLGIYSSAVQLASVVPSIVFAIGTVVAPKLAGFDDDVKAKNYLKKVQLFTLFLAALGVVFAIPLARLVNPVFYGVNYLEAVRPFSILIIAQAIFLISVPAHSSVFYYFEYPKLFVFIALGNIILTFLAGMYLISHYGFMGAAYTVLIGNTFNFIVPAFWVVRKFGSRK